MTPLAGELIAYPSPNRPGWWAYRTLADGTVLETQLTAEEWQALHARAVEHENDAVDLLNQQPINQIALALLRRAGSGPVQAGALRSLHVLSLAGLSLAEDDGGASDDVLMRFSDFTTSVSAMRVALHRLESAGITPEELLEETPVDASRRIVEILEIL